MSGVDALVSPRVKPPRVAYLDWMRGLAVVVMMEIHSFDAWLRPDARDGDFFRLARFLGGFPAPAFIYMSGFALALAVGAARRATAGASPGAGGRPGFAGRTVGERSPAPPTGARHLAGRAALILFGAYAFRFCEQLSWAVPPGLALVNALHRNDVLNCIGVSLLAVSLLAGLIANRALAISASVAIAAALALLTPSSQAWAEPAGLPHALWLYVQGGPPETYFPLFPWAGFAFAGAAAGQLASAARGDSARERRAIGVLFAIGLTLFFGSIVADHSAVTWFPGADYWHSSPNYFAARTGYLTALCAVLWAVDRATAARLAGSTFRPLVKLGRHSLLVYWVHIELVYGRVSYPIREKLGIPLAVTLYVTLVALMTAVSYGRDPLWTAVKRRYAALVGSGAARGDVRISAK